MKKLTSIFPILVLYILLQGYSAKGIPDKMSYKSGTEYNLQTDTAQYRSLIKIDSFMLEVVPPSSGVRLFKDGLVFLSWTKNEAIIPGHVSFGNAETYFAIPEDSMTGKHELFSSLLPFPYPSEAITFSSDNNTMYFTGYSKAEKSEKIYRADFSVQKDGHPTWTTDAKPLDFCNGKFIYSHPALSKDGRAMIFVSDMESSSGGLDLFLTKKVNENWSIPENLGDLINSKGNELYPFLDTENNLYFSSDREPGSGGYDIYISLFNGTNWDKPAALDKVINSEDDDIAFNLNSGDGRTAFFTVKERTGKRKMQLYRVSIDPKNKAGDKFTLSDLFTGLVRPELKTTSSASGQPAGQAVSIPLTEEVKKEIPVKESAPVQEKEIITETKVPQAATPPKADVPVKEGLVYRIQLFSNMKPKGSYQINFDGKTYNTFEYFHNGAYRSCIGEFNDPKSATAFQNTLRKSGYPQAFVIALINNVRSLDPALFK